MLCDDLVLLMFTSAKGHFGYKNSYEFVMNDLWKHGFTSVFKKIAHIKYRGNEDHDAELIEENLKFNSYEVIKTRGDWEHNSSSHAKEYYKDQLKLFSSHAKPYSLFQEDDYFLHCSGETIYKYFYEAIEFLEKNPQALCVRINAEPDRHINGATKITDSIYRQDEDRTVYGSTFTFQPTILRTRDYLAALRIINNNLHLLDSVHCEILSGQVFKQFSDDKSPFYFFDPDLVWCEHIGEKEKLEKLNETNIN